MVQRITSNYRGLASEFQYLYYFTQKGYHAFKIDYLHIMEGEKLSNITEILNAYYNFLEKNDEKMFELIKIVFFVDLYLKVRGELFEQGLEIINKKRDIIKPFNEQKIKTKPIPFLKEILGLTEFSDNLMKKLIDFCSEIAKCERLFGCDFVFESFREVTFPDLLVYKKEGDKITEIFLAEVKTNSGELNERQKKYFPKINKVLRELGLDEIKLLHATMTDTCCKIELS